MLNKLRAIAILAPLVILFPGMTGVSRAQTQSTSLEDLHTNLQAAVCDNDWGRALQYINPIIASPQLSDRSRTQFIQFRRQLQAWRTTSATVDNIANCEAARTAAEPASVDPRPIDWQQVAAPYRRDTTATTASGPRPGSSTQARGDRAQCTNLGAVVGQSDQEAMSVFQGANFSDINSLLQTMSQLATISDRAAANLQALQLSDAQLRTYLNGLVNMYETFGQSAREFVTAFNSGSVWTMEAALTEMENTSSQGLTLANQINTYCGWTVVTTYEMSY